MSVVFLNVPEPLDCASGELRMLLCREIGTYRSTGSTIPKITNGIVGKQVIAIVGRLRWMKINRVVLGCFS
jgi:hypothetical protein